MQPQQWNGKKKDLPSIVRVTYIHNGLLVIINLSLLASSLSAYLSISQVRHTYTIPRQQPYQPGSPESYDFVNYAIPRNYSYAGIDSYGVPVGEPLLCVPALAPDLDYYSYPTATSWIYYYVTAI